MRKVLGAVFAAILLTVCWIGQAAHVQAQAMEVEVCPPTGDRSDCTVYTSLKDAVNEAATNSVVTIPSGTVTENGITIENKNLTIRGAGARTTIVRGADTLCAEGNSDRVFRINSARVRIEGLTITNGCVIAPSQTPFGGGIWSSGSLTLKNVIVQGNIITYTDSLTYAENWTPQGGGIYSVGSLEIIDSAILSNVINSPVVGGMGGGVFNNGSNSKITNSTISGNVVSGIRESRGRYQGGGVYNEGSLLLEYNTIVLNTADTAGGGIYNVGDVELANNLIFANNSLDGQAICATFDTQPSGAACDTPLPPHVELGHLRGDTPVPAFSPSPNSDSIDRGVCVLSRNKFDLMGNRRGQGRECDLGVLEGGANFLPTVKVPQPIADLVVREIIVEPKGPLTAGTQATIKVVIQNIGTQATQRGFYVELFINPATPPPNYAGTYWADLCRTAYCNGDEGIVWEAPPTIYPGESFVFSADVENNPYIVRLSSKWDKYFSEGPVKLWAFVDWFEPNLSPMGNVEESNESNNLYEAPAFTVLPGRIPLAAAGAEEPDPDLFAPLPQP